MGLRLPSNVLFFAPFALVLLAGCGGGGAGDEPSEPARSVLGNGHRFSDLVGPADWVDPGDSKSTHCNQPADKTVLVSGVTVMAVDQFDEVATGQFGNLYVQDTTKEPGEFEGMTVFAPAYTPPDLHVARGDVLDFFGVITEFIGPSTFIFGNCKTLPEISGTGTFRFEGSPTPAKVVKIEDILGYQNARRYMGMLVTLEDVTVASDPVASSDTLPTGGRYTIEIDRRGADVKGVDAADYPRISNELFDLMNKEKKFKKGDKIASLTGIVTYFGGFKIAPRSADDIVLP